MKDFTSEVNKVIGMIKEAKRIVVFPTARIDLDCISSARIFKKICKSINPNVEVDIYSDFQVDEYHSFIKGDDEFNVFLKGKTDFSEYDFSVIVDGSLTSQLLKKNLGRVEITLPTNQVVIDHHSEANTANPDSIMIIDSSFKSTSVLLWELFIKPLNLSTSDIATLALAGYLGDTGYFRWVEKVEDFRHLDDLLKNKADIKLLADNYFKFLNFSDLKICLKFTELTTFDYATGLYIVGIPLKFEGEQKLHPDLFNDVKDYYLLQLQNTRGWKVIVTIKESPNDFVWVSLRSSDENVLDCSMVAREIGKHGNGTGGGHKRASGANMKMNYDEAKRYIEETIRKYLVK